jgi:hypothetical protein
MSSSIEITCIGANCGRRVTVPTDKGPIKLRCSHCNSTWVFTPPSVPDMRELNFRCATTGKQFKVAFARLSKNHQYRIVHIFPHVAFQQPARNSGLSPVSGRAELFDATEFSFAGWHCPHCGYGRDSDVESIFVRCGTCRECVCGSRIIRVSSRVSTFECHDGCKGGGMIQGDIEGFEGAPIDVALGRELQDIVRPKGADTAGPPRPVLPEPPRPDRGQIEG